jgi:hypothetical protein
VFWQAHITPHPSHSEWRFPWDAAPHRDPVLVPGMVSVMIAGA